MRVHRGFKIAAMLVVTAAACEDGDQPEGRQQQTAQQPQEPNPWGIVQEQPPSLDPPPATIDMGLYQGKTNIPFQRIIPGCEHYLRTAEDTVLVPHVGAATNIPEFHDCQRMIDQSGKTYGSLIGIYATQERPTAPDTSKAYLVAVMINYDDMYEPLQIDRGVSCLYVRLARPPLNDAAWIIPNGDGLWCIFERLVATLPASELEVKRTRAANLADYPRVARWDWDANQSRNHQYIGVECGGWCEIGVKGFVPSAVPNLPGNIIGGGTHRVYKIKGWYDAQRLAVIDPATNRLVPGPVIGYLFPAPALDHVTSLAQFNAAFPVAVAFLSGPSTVYEKKYMLTNTTGTQIAYEAVSTTSPKAKLSKGANPGESRMHRTPHPPGAPKVRGTARWHWSESDETMWTGCVNGCCQVAPME